MYCLGTTRSDEHACQAGTYRDTVGADKASGCDPCPAAQYCEEASIAPKDCPAGTYSDAGVTG